ncbi:MAG: class I SAM-dependent methyltransferase [Chloroflexota bacterium]|nr:class I SAM-dependent methyltransferase [Chloroflexota bacterium]
MDRESWNRLYTGADPDPGTGTEALFLAIGAALTPGHALDLGCGPGTLALGLAEHGWHVTGVDFAEAAIDLARTAARDHGLKATFVVADAAQWRPPRLFDLVVSAYALPPKGPNRRAVLATATKALATGGTLIVAEWERSMATAWNFMEADALASVDEVAAALAGLDIDRAEVLDVEMHGSLAKSVFVKARKRA